jgi:hypothetical protein
MRRNAPAFGVWWLASRSETDDVDVEVGSISESWLAEHRATSDDHS